MARNGRTKVIYKGTLFKGGHYLRKYGIWFAAFDPCTIFLCLVPNTYDSTIQINFFWKLLWVDLTCALIKIVLVLLYFRFCPIFKKMNQIPQLFPLGWKVEGEWFGSFRGKNENTFWDFPTFRSALLYKSTIVHKRSSRL